MSAMQNRFPGGANSNAPALAHYDGDAKKSDTANLPEVCREVYVGVGGNVKLTDTSGATVIYQNVPSGASITGFWTRLWATGTTATGLVVGV